MIAVFHSPVIGQAGCHSAMAAIATVASTKFKQKVLIIQLRDNVTPVEKILFNREIESKTVRNEAQNFDQTGIDALLAMVSTSKMKRDNFENFSVMTSVKNENLTIIGVTRKQSIENELDASFSAITHLLKSAESLHCYDWIFVSVPKTGSRFTQNLLKLRDLNILSVMCVPQNMMIIKDERRKNHISGGLFRRNNDADIQGHRKLLLLGNFDVESKFSPRNIAACYGIRQDKICSILHDAHYKDALSQGDLYNFIIKNLENDVDDDIYSFPRYLMEATGKLLAQDYRDGRMIYTEPLPEIEQFTIVSTEEEEPEHTYEVEDDFFMEDPDEDLFDLSEEGDDEDYDIE